MPKVIILVLFSFLFSSCNSGGLSFDSKPKNTLRVHLNYEPLSLDYSLVEDGMSFRLINALMTGLVFYDEQYNLKLGLAESMEVLNSGKLYRFKLKKINWSDGVPLEAKDFVYAFSRTLSSEVNSKLGNFLFPIINAKNFKIGKLKDFSKVGIRAVQSDILEIELEKKTPNFPHVLTLSVGLPQRKDIIEKYGKKWPTHAPSLGPYKLLSWENDQKIILEQNSESVRFEIGQPDHIEFVILPEESSAITLFEKNGIDLVFKVPHLEMERFKKSGRLVEFPYFAIFYLGFNTTQKPWSDRKSRLAFAKALDKKELVKILNGSERVADEWLPSEFSEHRILEPLFSPEKDLKSLWNDSAGKEFKKIEISFDASSRNQLLLEKIQQEVQNKLGVKVELKARDWKSHVGALTSGATSVFRFGWLSPFLDSYTNMSIFRSDNPNNYTQIKDLKIDETLDKIQTLETNDTNRVVLLKELQEKVIRQESFIVPIYHYTQSILVLPRVKHLWVNGFGNVDYTKIRLK